MSKTRARSLKALALLRKTELDREAGALVTLRGLTHQIEAQRQDNLARAASAAEVDTLEVMPYMRDYLRHIDQGMRQLDADEAALEREILAQQARVTQAWRGLRVVEKVAERAAKRAEEEALKLEANAQDERALITYATQISQG